MKKILLAASILFGLLCHNNHCCSASRPGIVSVMGANLRLGYHVGKMYVLYKALSTLQTGVSHTRIRRISRQQTIMISGMTDIDEGKYNKMTKMINKQMKAINGKWFLSGASKKKLIDTLQDHQNALDKKYMMCISRKQINNAVNNFPKEDI